MTEIDLLGQLKKLQVRKNEAIKNGEYETGAYIRDSEKELIAKIDELRNQRKDEL